MLDQNKNPMGRGLRSQRVDGTTTEKQAVKDVLARMDKYMISEVLSNADYEAVRSKWYVDFSFLLLSFFMWSVHTHTLSFNLCSQNNNEL